MDSENQWVWLVGGDIAVGDAWLWRGACDPAAGGELCMVLEVAGSEACDVLCAMEHPFICEQE